MNNMPYILSQLASLLLPAQAQGWQKQDHEDEEGVALVHCRPVLSRPIGTENISRYLFLTF